MSHNSEQICIQGSDDGTSDEYNCEMFYWWLPFPVLLCNSAGLVIKYTKSRKCTKTNNSIINTLVKHVSLVHGFVEEDIDEEVENEQEKHE